MSTIWMVALGWALAGEPAFDAAGVDAPASLTTPARAALAAADARTLAASSLPDATLADLAEDAGWRVRARAAAAVQWRVDPALAAHVSTVASVPTRSGTPRFTDRALRDPDVAGLLVERLVAGGDAPAVREALVEALRHTDGDWADAAAGLLATERDAGVRAQLAATLRDAEADAAIPGLALAARDADARVRAAAMRAIGGRKDGAALLGSVLAATTDTDAAVRAAAVRAVGWLGLSEGWSGLVARLGDADADVRLQAVGALERLDADRAAALPELARLGSDPDGRVARAVERVLGR